MRSLPPDFDDRNEFHPVFVRTDYSDGAAWQDMVNKLNDLPDGWDGENWDVDDMPKYLVDDPRGTAPRPTTCWRCSATRPR
ncbi:hypothetical protein ACFQZ4_24345 [Catellatospora coxensis]